jgi:cobalt-zinc-cadmium efflux system outer membrane protein
MRMVSLIAAQALWIGISGTAFAGYRDLKQDMEAYTPPALLQQPAVPGPAAITEADSFAVEKKTIEDARDRWTKTVKEKVLSSKGRPIPPALIAAAADDASTIAELRERLSLQTVQALILVRNPSIKAATRRFQAALEGFDQVTQMDEILRQYSAFTESVMAGVGPMRGSDNIGMKFPFPGVTALKGQVAEKNVQAEKQQLSLVQRDIVARGGKAYWNLLYTHRALRITRDTLDRLNHLESVATTRYGAGKTSYQDVIKIRIGREKLEEQLDTLKKQRVNLEIELLTLMDLQPGISLGWPATTTPDISVPKLDALYPLALEKRQELNRMRAMVGKMERMLEMAETMIQPTVSQNLSLYTDEAILQVRQRRHEADVRHHGFTFSWQRPAQECLVRCPGCLSSRNPTQTRRPARRAHRRRGAHPADGAPQAGSILTGPVGNAPFTRTGCWNWPRHPWTYPPGDMNRERFLLPT